MPRRISVHFLPQLTSSEQLTDGIVVVIDILRASTTITHALAAGAEAVLPCFEIEEALEKKQAFPAEQVLLGGERHGVVIPGFDLGNSPSEYTAERVQGKLILFSTTNGTRAMALCREAAEVLIGSFVNGTACLNRLLETTQPIHLLCAGSGGEITREDCLFAGWLVQGCLEESSDWELNDQALLALSAFTSLRDLPTQLETVQAMWHEDQPPAESVLETALRLAKGGMSLQRLGLGRDIHTAAQLDIFSLLPKLDTEKWRIES